MRSAEEAVHHLQELAVAAEQLRIVCWDVLGALEQSDLGDVTAEATFLPIRDRLVQAAESFLTRWPVAKVAIHPASVEHVRSLRHTCRRLTRSVLVYLERYLQVADDVDRTQARRVLGGATKDLLSDLDSFFLLIADLRWRELQKALWGNDVSHDVRNP